MKNRFATGVYGQARMRTPSPACERAGSLTTAAATVPRWIAGTTAGGGNSTNCAFMESAPLRRIHSRVAHSDIVFTPFTAIACPSRSLAVRRLLSFAVQRADVGAVAL